MISVDRKIVCKNLENGLPPFFLVNHFPKRKASTPPPLLLSFAQPPPPFVSPTRQHDNDNPLGFVPLAQHPRRLSPCLAQQTTPPPRSLAQKTPLKHEQKLELPRKHDDRGEVKSCETRHGAMRRGEQARSHELVFFFFFKIYQICCRWV